MPNRIEEILLEASQFFIKQEVIDLATKWNEKSGQPLEECYEDAFKLLMKDKGYE